MRNDSEEFPHEGTEDTKGAIRSERDWSLSDDAPEEMKKELVRYKRLAEEEAIERHGCLPEDYFPWQKPRRQPF